MHSGANAWKIVRGPDSIRGKDTLVGHTANDEALLQAPTIDMAVCDMQGSFLPRSDKYETSSRQNHRGLDRVLGVARHLVHLSVRMRSVSDEVFHLIELNGMESRTNTLPTHQADTLAFVSCN